MIRKLLILTIILYLLVILQTSFLVHFNIAGLTLNIALFLVIIWNILEDPKKYLGIYLALIAGFFLDVFSSYFIGFNILIFLMLSLFIKYIFKKYVRIPFLEKI